MRYFIVAGEQSGDLHGSNLVRALRKADPDALIDAWGGDLMENAGANLLMHYKKTAFMGFTAVLGNLRTISMNLMLCRKQIEQAGPDVVILIDYPAFNLRIARFARKNGYRVFYYISPKIWAWKENRVQKIKKYVDRIYTILPFEKGFYEKHGMEVEYFGNPLVDEIESEIDSTKETGQVQKNDGQEEKPVIALLPGSRRQEIEYILPQMLKVIPFFPQYMFTVTCVRNIPLEFYKEITGNIPVRLAINETYSVLRSADAALVTSGTATLEAALMGTPQVVCYKGDLFSALIAWMLIKVKYVSLVNLIMGYEVVKELLQYSLNEKNLVSELRAILPGGERREKIFSDYRLLAEKLGPSGASVRVAEDMVRRLKVIGDR